MGILASRRGGGTSNAAALKLLRNLKDVRVTPKRDVKIKRDATAAKIIKVINIKTNTTNDKGVRLNNAKNEPDIEKLAKRSLLHKVSSSELEKHRSNIRHILQYSNATPIRCRGGIGYACSFCGNEYPDPADLKIHTTQSHEEKSLLKFMTGTGMGSYLVKLDITNLTCKICLESVDSLENLTDHLIKNHSITIFTDIKSHIMPFKFDDEVLRCIYCMNVFNKFKNLQQHMNVHFRNYICTVCDAGFINTHILACHSEGHKIGIFKCDLCPKVFDTHRKKKSHEKSVHIHASMLSKCGYCNQKFTNYRKKDEHLVKVHGVHMNAIKCNACEKTFDTKSALTIHTKRDHLMERRHKCERCEMRFFGSNELKLHMVKHTGSKEFKCDVCFKSYGRKKTLTEHMRIHNDDRRFKCEHCGQAFVQKCSWKGHMRNRHGEMI